MSGEAENTAGYEDDDPINHPPHYTAHPSGVECIQITEHMSFCIGNAVKYLWRADLKSNAMEDLAKALWYVAREINMREQKVKCEIAWSTADELAARVVEEPDE